MGIEYVHAIVERSTFSRVPVYVPAYEIPVLEAIHGSVDATGTEVPAVFVQGEPEVQDGDFDPVEAYDALRRKYPNQERVIASVYRNPGDLARSVKIVKRKKAEPEVVAA